MMTQLEAADRAYKIWPDWELLSKRYDDTWWVAVGDAMHILDGNGHTLCHPECARIEEKIP